MATRFVILVHSGHGPLHFDLMLEQANHLATWQFSQDPVVVLLRGKTGTDTPPNDGGSQSPVFRRDQSVPGFPSVSVATSLIGRKIQDHRLVYLDYDGPVSAGRGHVHRRDWGELRMIEASENHLRFALHGRILRGTFDLRRQEDGRWVLLLIE